MIRFLIYRPISVTTVYFALLLLAIIGASRIPVSMFPDIDIPRMTIMVETSNRSAREVENTILKPLRRKLLQVNDIKDLESVASKNSGIVELTFDYGKDIDHAFIEVNEKVDQSLNDLPNGIVRPRVIKSRVSDLPAFYLSVAYKKNTFPDFTQSFLALSDLAEQKISRRLEQLNSIAIVDITGTREREILIQPNEELIASLEIAQDDIQAALENANIDLGTILIKERNYQYTVKLGNTLSSINDVRNIQLKVGERILPLSKIAEIKIRQKPNNGIYISNGKQAICMAVIKSQSARIDDLKDSFDQLLINLEQTYPDLEFTISQDQTYLLAHSIDNLKQSLLWGIVLAIGIVFFFYRDWRIPIIIGLIIPISIALSLLCFNIFGLSLNIISLSGLILGLGLMIDNGIIVLDNISQSYLTDKETACIKGTNEMIRPLLTSMLTTCSVFVPLIFLSGISGALFFDQAVVIAIGLGISYIISITLLPTLYFILPIKKPNPKRIKNSIGHRFYNSGFKLTFNYPIIIVLFTMVVLLLGVYSAISVPLKFLPQTPKNTFEVYINWNEFISPKEGHTRLEKVLETSNKHIAYYNALIGLQQFIINRDPNQKRNAIHLFVEGKRGENINSLQESILKRLTKLYPKASIRFQAEKNIFEQLFPYQESNLDIKGYTIGDNNERDFLKLHYSLSAFLHEKQDGLSINDLQIEDQLVIEPIQEQLMFFDVDRDLLFNELKRSLGSRELIQIRNFNYVVPVVIGANDQLLEEVINKLQIRNNLGNRIPVKYLIKIKRKNGLREIKASKIGAYLPINIQNENPEGMIHLLEQFKEKEPDYYFEFSGSYFENKELLRELLLVLGISLLLLYFIMAAQFESLLQPIIIILEIPISLAGSLFLLWILGRSLNVMSMIGMVVTVGIIINDSIIKIDTINRLRKANLSLKEAIHQGGLLRLNPIIMTSFTTILAVVPFFFAEGIGAILQQPLGIAVIGGMLVGTLVSIFVIPLLYFAIYKNHPSINSAINKKVKES